MYTYRCLNNISKVGLDRFTADYQKVGENESSDAILVRSANMKEMEFDGSLKAIARAGAGVNNIPLDKAAEQGIVVFNTPGANANAVKELVLAGLLLSSRGIVDGIEWLKEEPWTDDLSKRVEKQKKNYAGHEIKGKTLGIIGLGAIGVMVANAASGLGMKVVGYDPYLSLNAAFNLSSKIKYVKDLSDLLTEADYITIHVPLSDNTRGMVGKDEVAKMKDGVRVLNFARNGLIDDDALVEALKSGKVASYVTDFVTEKIKTAPHTIITPHLGASTQESEDNCAEMAADEIRDYLENGNIKHSVNYPALDMGACNAEGRVAINHRNVPKMLARLTDVLGEANVNVANISNASRGNYAYTLIDTDSALNEEIVKSLEGIDGVLKVRIVK